MRNSATQLGFTLIEAVVAMVLISSAGYALFAWINNSVNNLDRIKAANERMEATRNALEYLRTTNPMESASGERRLGTYLVRWFSTPITMVRDGSPPPGGTTNIYRFALYRTVVDIAKSGQPGWVRFEFEQLGYKKARVLSFDQ